MSTELLVHVDHVDPLVRLQGLVSACDVAYQGYDKEELIQDVGEAACDFIHAMNAWQTTARANMPPNVELKYAIVRYVKAHSIEQAQAGLRQWIEDLDTDIMREALQ